MDDVYNTAGIGAPTVPQITPEVVSLSELGETYGPLSVTGECNYLGENVSLNFIIYAKECNVLPKFLISEMCNVRKLFF